MYSTFACALVLSGVPRIDWTSAFVMPIRMLLSFAEDSHPARRTPASKRSEEHTSELQSPCNLVCRLLLEKNEQSEKHGRSSSEKARAPRTGGTDGRRALARLPSCVPTDRSVAAGKIALLLAIFFNDTATTEIYTLSLHDALPIWGHQRKESPNEQHATRAGGCSDFLSPVYEQSGVCRNARHRSEERHVGKECRSRW